MTDENVPAENTKKDSNASSSKQFPPDEFKIEANGQVWIYRLSAEPSERLTPEEFKSEVQQRGWTYRLLAERWEVTPNWISKTARNEGRSTHWDDAVRGLPILLGNRPR